MAVSVDWNTLVISVPQSDLTFVSGTLYALDTEAFRREMIALMDDVVGMPFLDPISHNTEVTIAGVTYARFIEIINGYTVTFEDGQYAVRLDGSNNNIFDEGIINRNQVSVIPTNSAGLIRTEVAEKPTAAHLSAAYDDDTDVLELAVWVERLGFTVDNPTSCSVDWYEPDGTLLFTVSDSSPDAQGIFQITRASTTLVANTAYYVEVSVTDSAGTVTTTRGTPTGP